MNLYIDTEFNGFGGELISMALVGDRLEFYEVVSMSDPLDPWVEENVTPYLEKAPISVEEFQYKLQDLLSFVEGPLTIHADWPDDIAYFCKALITGPGTAINFWGRLNFVLDRNLSSGKSKIPHNALEDARAIMESAR